MKAILRTSVALVAATLTFLNNTIGKEGDPSFIEAAMFFFTSLEPIEGDVITDDSITLVDLPLQIYRIPDDPCVARLRRTRPPLSVWEMNFCKVAMWHTGAVGGYFVAFYSGSGPGQKVIWLSHGEADVFGYLDPSSQEEMKNQMARRTKNPSFGYQNQRQQVHRVIASYQYIIETFLGYRSKPY
jgi:hypothetical protein